MTDILRTAERKAGIETARAVIEAGGLGELIIAADRDWISGKSKAELPIPLLLVLLTMAAERKMDRDMGLVR